MEPVTTRHRWTVEDFLTGRKITLRLNRFLFYLRLAVGTSIPAYTLWEYCHGNPGWTLILPYAMILPAVNLMQSVIIRNQLRKRPDINAEVEWMISDQKFINSTPHSKADFQWSAFQKVVATPKGFLFMPNRQIFHFIPTRAFETPADIENLKTLARQHAKEFKELK